MACRQNHIFPLHFTPLALRQPWEPELLLTLDVLQPYLAGAGCLLLGVACQHGRMPAKAACGPPRACRSSPRRQKGWVGTASIATKALPSSTGPGGSP